MGRHNKKRVMIAKSSGITVGSGGIYADPGRRTVVILVAAGILLFGGAAVLLYEKHVHDQHAAAAKKLQATVRSADSLGNDAKLKADSDSLIQGAANGTYSVKSADLAQAYISRADVELNAGNYKAALADYEKAAQVDSSQKQAVAYGEFLSRYHLGERSTLVPLLQSMEVPLKDNHDDPQAQQQLALYDQYIADLQAGKDLAL